MVKQVVNKVFDMSKGVVLFGVNDAAANFCKQWGRSVKILYSVTGLSEDAARQPLLEEFGVDTRLLDDTTFAKGHTVIVCDKFTPSTTHLIACGLAEYHDYVHVYLAEAFLSKKKLAVFMGTALMRQVVTLLGQHEAFSSEYSSAFFPDDSLLKAYSNETAAYHHVARCCDLYVHSVCEGDRYQRKILSPSDLPPGCITASISDYSFWGYHPQLNRDRHIKSDYFLRERIRIPVLYNTLAFARQDIPLETMCNDGLRPETAVQKICSESFYSKDKALSHYKEALETIKKADEYADIRMGGYLSEYTGGLPANRNLDEWNAGALIHVISELFKHIGLSCAAPEYGVIKSVIEDVSGSEIPIYPSVASHLNLYSVDKNTQYKIVTFYKTMHMTFEEYANFAVEYLYKSKELINLIRWEWWHTPSVT